MNVTIVAWLRPRPLHRQNQLPKKRDNVIAPWIVGFEDIDVDIDILTWSDTYWYCDRVGGIDALYILLEGLSGRESQSIFLPKGE